MMTGVVGGQGRDQTFMKGWFGKYVITKESSIHKYISMYTYSAILQKKEGETLLRPPPPPKKYTKVHWTLEGGGAWWGF